MPYLVIQMRNVPILLGKYILHVHMYTHGMSPCSTSRNYKLAALDGVVTLRRHFKYSTVSVPHASGLRQMSGELGMFHVNT